jgi:hypothetical protein
MNLEATGFHSTRRALTPELVIVGGEPMGWQLENRGHLRQ